MKAHGCGLLDGKADGLGCGTEGTRSLQKSGAWVAAEIELGAREIV